MAARPFNMCAILTRLEFSYLGFSLASGALCDQEFITKMRILLTTTSFQDVPGPHHKRLEGLGHEIVALRGPVSEDILLQHAGNYDAVLCGDDPFTREILHKFVPRLKVISKYGIGVDKIDLEAASEFGIPVGYCPGVNHTTVAEHCFALMLALNKKIFECVTGTKAGLWTRPVTGELYGKTLGIVGLGRIGKEVALRAKAFGMRLVAYDIHWDAGFAASQSVERAATLADLLAVSDVVSLNTTLTP